MPIMVEQSFNYYDMKRKFYLSISHILLFIGNNILTHAKKGL